MTNVPSVPRLKRLLATTDLSARAEKALARAAQLAEEHKARLTVLHVKEDAVRDEAQTQQVAVKVEDDLCRKVEVVSLPRDGTATMQVVTGKPFVEIIRRAREEAADLIVVGAHGEHFIKDLFLGTTAQKIVRKGDRPVLVAKRATRGPYCRVLVAVDFSDNSRHALEFALQLAPRAEFYVLHAYEGFEGQLQRAGVTKTEIMRHRRQLAKEARQEMKVFLGSIDCGDKQVRREMWYGRAPHEITRVANRLRADLVAVGTAGRTGLPYILLGSVGEHVMREVSSDVLVVRSGSLCFEFS